MKDGYCLSIKPQCPGFPHTHFYHRLYINELERRLSEAHLC